MEWLRWYHGTINDPKWAMIARKTGVNICTVIAIWAALLEYASQNEDRGSVADFDPEEIDAAFGLNDGECAAVIEAMTSKGIIEAARIAKWSKRQFDEKNVERIRRCREKKAKAEAEATPADTSAKCSGNDSEMTVKCSRNDSEMVVKRDEIPDTDTDSDTDIKKMIMSLTGHVSVSPKKPPVSCPCEQIVEAYSAILPGLLPVQRLTDARRKALAARWREDKTRQSLAWWNDYFERVRGSDFLMGRCAPTQGRSSAWQADFDWLIKPANLQKVIEGKYDNHARAAPDAPTYADVVQKYGDILGLTMDDVEAETVEAQAEEVWI